MEDRYLRPGEPGSDAPAPILDSLEFSDYNRMMKLASEFRKFSSIQAQWAEDPSTGEKHRAGHARQARRALTVAHAIERFAIPYYDPKG